MTNKSVYVPQNPDLPTRSWCVHLPDSLKPRLKAFAARDGRLMYRVVEDAIVDYLDAHEGAGSRKR